MRSLVCSKYKHTCNIRVVYRIKVLKLLLHGYHISADIDCLQINTQLMVMKEGNVLFNDTLNTFYLQLYGVGHMVKYHSDSERGNPLPPHRLYLLKYRTGVLLYASSHRQDSTYHSLCYTSRGALAGRRNSSMGPPHEGSI